MNYHYEVWSCAGGGDNRLAVCASMTDATAEAMSADRFGLGPCEVVVVAVDPNRS